MLILEAVCVALVAMYVVANLFRRRERAAFLWRLGLITAAAWIAEDSCIRLYGFYAYSPRWHLFVDRVPLMIVLIWPIVINSTYTLCRGLLGERARAIPLLGAALVLADASLIEPISVKAGLWWWTRPGLFDVPPIGLLGWGIFAGLSMAVFERSRTRTHELAVLAVVPAATHLLLLAAWWGLFRWVEAVIPFWPVVVVVWGLSLVITLHVVRGRVQDRLLPADMLLRIPPTLFFTVLLALYGRNDLALVLYIAAFAPPYLALTPWGRTLRSLRSQG